MLNMEPMVVPLDRRAGDERRQVAETKKCRCDAMPDLLAALNQVTMQYEAFLREHRLVNDPFHKRVNQNAAQAIAKAEGL